MAMEPVKIGIPGVRDRQGSGQGSQRRKKKGKRRGAAQAGAAEPGPRAPASLVDPEFEDGNELWPEEPRVGRHLNVVA